MKLVKENIFEYGETNISSVNQDENIYKKIHGQQYITEEGEDDEEELEESISFQRGGDPKKTLGIGQQSLIEKWIDEMINSRHNVEFKDYKINQNYTIDAKSVSLEHCGLIELPEYIQFNRINHSFFIGYNNLISLRGCPKYVGGTFGCSGNKLVSLKYAPKKVKAHFFCRDNSPHRFSIDDVLEYSVVYGSIEAY
jgi:hypothetical protein